jgi:hypothetical protein
MLPAFSASAMAQPPPVPMGLIAVTFQNGFLLEGHSVFVNDTPYGAIAPGGNRTMTLYRDSTVRIVPSISQGATTVVDRPGTYLIYPPCVGCPAVIVYQGG